MYRKRFQMGLGIVREDMIPLFFFILLATPDISVLCSKFSYETIDVVESKLERIHLVESGASLSQCAVLCEGTEGCEGFRRNLQGNGSCELGKYFLGNDFVQAYNPGNFSTFFKLRRSDDNCFVKYPGQANTEMAEEFCPRMGGRVPDLRQDGELERILSATTGTPLAIRQDDSGVWRYTSDGAEAPEPPQAITNVSDSSSWVCGRLGLSSYARYPCTRIHFACQFC